VITPLPNSCITVSNRSAAEAEASLPPGLRFPSGAIIGSSLVVAGTHLSSSTQSFEIWALDLTSMTWSYIDVGGALSEGSWLRTCYWPRTNKYLVFGNLNGNLIEDYNRRALRWDHVVVIDLEAFGIYQPPRLELGIPQQVLSLAALEENVLADFELICDDRRQIKCSWKPLEDRWPWFKRQRSLYLQAAARAIESSHSIPSSDTPLSTVGIPSTQVEEPDPQLSYRTLMLGESYPVTLAFLQYLYSMALLTPLQHTPAVISRLLLLSNKYNLPHLRSLVIHALHQALRAETALGIYHLASAFDCQGLQTRLVGNALCSMI
jgi:leucine-zipper-like transcriptional regulator 1